MFFRTFQGHDIPSTLTISLNSNFYVPSRRRKQFCASRVLNARWKPYNYAANQLKSCSFEIDIPDFLEDHLHRHFLYFPLGRFSAPNMRETIKHEFCRLFVFETFYRNLLRLIKRKSVTNVNVKLLPETFRLRRISWVKFRFCLSFMAAPDLLWWLLNIRFVFKLIF